MEKYGVSDVFLIDGPSGKVVYNVSKEVDFGGSLREGPLASSSLGTAFLQAVSSGRRDAVAFGQFQRYLPSCNEPASFMAAPIYEGRTLVGAVAFQVPINKVNAIIGETTGMGRTGETYAIGADRLFRSDSRFAEEMGAKSTIINPEFKVDTAAVRSAIDEGKAGTAEAADYRGVPSLVSWRPVTIHRDASGRGDVRWALLSEIDSAEVFEPVSRLLKLGLMVFGLTSAAVLAVSTLIARRLTREAQRQAALVGGIVDNTHALASSSEELTSVSQQMSAAAGRRPPRPTSCRPPRSRSVATRGPCRARSRTSWRASTRSPRTPKMPPVPPARRWRWRPPPPARWPPWGDRARRSAR
jgi:methyl-accepting chemotaxis protein